MKMPAKSTTMRLAPVLLQVGLLALLLQALGASRAGREGTVSKRAKHILQRDGFRPHCVELALGLCHTADTATTPASLEAQPSEAKDGGANGTFSLRSPSSQQEQNGVGLTQGRRRRHCQDLKEAGDTGRGLREIFPFPCCPDWGILVFCDQDTDEGGWIVFQRRIDIIPREDFQRTWVEYERGFGQLEGEFWLGLELLHKLTTLGGLQELRVDLGDCEGNTAYARYGFFHVGDSSSYYKMHCGRYSGDAGDSLSYHYGMSFTTHDADHDSYKDENCATKHSGPWWHNQCDNSNLNGMYLGGKTTEGEKGIEWTKWKGNDYSLCYSEMKIRTVS